MLALANLTSKAINPHLRDPVGVTAVVHRADQ